MSDLKTISLTDAPPVKIDPKLWPVVASAKAWDNQYEFQANRTWNMRVRQHADGRAIVYAWHTSQFQGEADVYAGEVLDAGEDIPAAIRRVADDAGCERTAQDCIQDLPATVLS